MSRVALIVDVGQGQEALLFSSQADAQAFLDKHPLVEECAHGMVPISGTGDVTQRVAGYTRWGRGPE